MAITEWFICVFPVCIVSVLSRSGQYSSYTTNCIVPPIEISIVSLQLSDLIEV